MNKIILHSLFLFFTFQVSSQELYDHKLNEEKWSDIRDNIRYEKSEPWQYENNEEWEKSNTKKAGGKGSGKGNGSSGSGGNTNSSPKSSSSPRISPSFSTQGLSTLGWVFLIVFIVAIIALIVYFILKMKPKDGNISIKEIDDYLDETPPHEIPKTELERRLEEALLNGDYRAAIRIYYLFILKDLSEKKWIIWERKKTNLHYLREMSSRAFYYDFNLVVSFFEIIWYGKRDIDKEQFYLIEPKFKILLDKLGIK